MPSREPGRFALAFILLTVLIDVVAFGIVGPVLPGLIMELTASNISQAALWGGVLLFIFALMQFFFAPILGNLSDAYGRRPVLLISLGALGLDYVLMSLAPNIWFLLVGRAIAGICGATALTANAYIADITPPEERAGRFGLIGAAFGVGFIIGPTLGGLLGEVHLRLPFIIAAGIAFLNFAYGYFVLPETLKAENRRVFAFRQAHVVGTILQLRKIPLILTLFGAIILYTLAHDALPSTWAYVNIEKFNWTPRDIGISMGLIGVCFAIVMGLITPFATRRFGNTNTAMIGYICGVLSFTIFAFAKAEWQLYVVLPIFALWGLIMPSLRAIMSNSVPGNAQGELQGGLSSVQSLTMIVGPLFMTGLFRAFTAKGAPIYFPGASFLASALLLIASMVIVTYALGRLGKAVAATPDR